MSRNHSDKVPPVDVCEFQVIGELKGDPGHLLLRGEDTRWYDYDIEAGTVTPIEEDGSREVDVIEEGTLTIEVSEENLTS